MKRRWVLAGLALVLVLTAAGALFGWLILSARGFDTSAGGSDTTKEVIGGYFVIEADHYAEAVELSRDCPHLDYGGIELRQIDVMDAKPL